MSISEDLVEEVRQRADLVELVAEHTRLKRSGKTFRGPCPLHGGSGPNFSVDPARNVFKCFVCGEGGDIFAFPMKLLGLGFPEAVRFVAGRVGIEIPESRERWAEPGPHDHLYEINAFAATWFREQLAGDLGSVARDYLERRGIGKDAADRFGLGWAPESWSALLEACRKHRIPETDLVVLGLAKISEKSGGRYDAYRGRIIFPIEQVGGRVVAFGGRVIGDELPKYVNSPESPIYRKGTVLYGLSWSRGAIRKAETALIVEGYMDFVALASHGVDNVVAPLGTALTEEQASLLARYARRVILLFDSDQAGLRATFRVGDALLRAGLEVLVATLPEGEDPDSLLRLRGPAALRAHLDDAVDILDRKLSLLDKRGAFASIAGVRRAIDRLLPTVRATSDQVLRGVYLTRIAERTGVPVATLEREVDVADAETHVSAGPRRDYRDRRWTSEARMPPPSRRAIGPERNLLLLLLRDESWIERAANQLSPDDFLDPTYRILFEVLLQSEGKRDPGGRWLESFPAEVIPLVEELRGDPEGEHLHAPEQIFDASVRRLQARPFEERLKQLQEELEGGSPQRQAELLQEKEQISRTMRERNLLHKQGALRARSP